MSSENDGYSSDYGLGAEDTERAWVDKTTDLVAKANKLVQLMDEAETQHGGLVGSVTLRAKNELRLELSKWR